MKNAQRLRAAHELEGRGGGGGGGPARPPPPEAAASSTRWRAPEPAIGAAVG
jgi:hypothetical protein